MAERVIRPPGGSSGEPIAQSGAGAGAAPPGPPSLVPVLSHELRSPLSVILSYADLMLSGTTGALTVEQRECVVDILMAARQAVGVLDDFLELSALEAGRLVLLPVATRASTVIADAVCALQRVADERGIRIGIAIDDGAEELVVDPRRLRQVVHHLLDHAIERTPGSGQVRVKVRAGADGSRDDQVHIDVEDDGPELTAEIIGSLFDPLAPVHAERGGRAGLELAVSQRLIDAMGGDVVASSLRGGGLRTTVTVPRRPRTRRASPR